MELWFWAAVAGAVLAGVSNFYFKQAAARGYNSELFSLYGSIISTPLVGIGLLFFSQPFWFDWAILTVVFLGGLLASMTNVLKIYALRYIDSTIYFPLFKLLAPGLAIVYGVFFFNETFSRAEWIGMLFGLFVPLMLITKVENQRQQNLFAGLVFIVITAAFSSSTAGLNKYATDLSMPFVTILMWTTLGVVVGSIFLTLWRRGATNLWQTMQEDTSLGLVFGGFMRSTLIMFSLGLMLFAFSAGGTLAVVQTIHSMYILIPIVLAVIFYNEHWNLQKVIAIVLSVAALALLG